MRSQSRSGAEQGRPSATAASGYITSKWTRTPKMKPATPAISAKIVSEPGERRRRLSDFLLDRCNPWFSFTEFLLGMSRYK